MYYLGIDLGGMSIKAGICDDNGKIIHKDTCTTVRDETGDRILDDMANLVFKVLNDTGLTVDDIEYAGVVSPGTADSEKGIIVFASTLPFLNYPIEEEFKKRTGIKKVYIENDANAAAKGEATYGAAKGYKNSILLTLGTGVGGGIILGGKVYSGFNYAGAELGHMVIIKDGIECSCGRKGCLESYASATALIRQTKEKMLADKDTVMWSICENDINRVNGKTAFDAMRLGDKAGIEVVNNFLEYLACGVINYINVFQPEILSIGGGISKERETLLKPLRKIIDREQYSRFGEKNTIITIADLGNDAGIIGAASLGK